MGRFAAIKWGSVTGILRTDRKAKEFWVGFVVIIAIFVVALWWTQQKKTAAQGNEQKVNQLSRIPELEKQVNLIPDLRNQLTAATAKESAKEGEIEDLENLLLNEERSNAEEARKSAKKVNSQLVVLGTQVVQVAQDVRPDPNTIKIDSAKPRRTLAGENRARFIAVLQAAGRQDVAINIVAPDDYETKQFSGEVRSAFVDAGWKLIPTTRTANFPISKSGVRILIGYRAGPVMGRRPLELTGRQAVLAQAFRAGGVEPTAVIVYPNGPYLEINIGLND